MANYLDAKAFTRLFKQRHRNHMAICNGLHLITQNVARNSYHFPTTHDREDAEQSAITHAISKIGKFNYRRAGANAFSYFTSVVVNALTESIGHHRKRTTSSLDELLTDEHEPSVCHRF